MSLFPWEEYAERDNLMHTVPGIGMKCGMQHVPLRFRSNASLWSEKYQGEPIRFPFTAHTLLKIVPGTVFMR